MDSNAVQPIVIKRVKKGGHGGHHGGSWKVAYADFVTAMMALFLLLWLLETTPKEDLKALEGYFKSPSMIEASGGASSSVIDMGGGMDAPKGEGGTILRSNPQDAPPPVEKQEESTPAQRELDELMERLKRKILDHPVLHSFRDQIRIDITEEGLRIQIVDQKNRPMFDSGKAKLKPYARVILREIGKVIAEVPNAIAISGHTDSRPYLGRKDYSNWELSSDRANAARREMAESGLGEGRIAKVVGLADSVPLLEDDPEAPVNRRITIVVTDKRVPPSFDPGKHKPVAEQLSEQLNELPPENTGRSVTVEVGESGSGMDADLLEMRLREMLGESR